MTDERFRAAWSRLVTAWSGAERPAAEALLRRALAEGLHAVAAGLPPSQGVGVGPGRRCEVDLVRLSGAVDVAGYLDHNPLQAERGVEPVDHFCRRGWRRLRNPSLAFDVWWYVTEYLDPADDSDAAINPLVHYLVDGRFRALLPLPEARARQPQRLDRPPRRVCLFAAYDPDGLVDDYVVDYVRELARFADVYVLADCEMQPGQFERLDGLVRGSWARRHGGHDFGSWSLLARELVGWDALADYDEVLLVNDSCWLLRPLDDVFARMDRQACDFWALQVTARMFEPQPGEPYSLPLDEVKRDWIPRAVFRSRESAHLGSYFLALRRPALDDPGLRRRLHAVVPQPDHELLVQKYEYGTTRYLVGQGFDFSTWLPDLRPNHPLYGPGAFDLLATGFPVFKRRFLIANPYLTPGLDRWKERMRAAVPDAPVEMFERNLRRVADPDALARSLAAGSAGVS